jgi:hypothetical protein
MVVGSAKLGVFCCAIILLTEFQVDTFAMQKPVTPQTTRDHDTINRLMAQIPESEIKRMRYILWRLGASIIIKKQREALVRIIEQNSDILPPLSRLARRCQDAMVVYMVNYRNELQRAFERRAARAQPVPPVMPETAAGEQPYFPLLTPETSEQPAAAPDQDMWPDLVRSLLN